MRYQNSAAPCAIAAAIAITAIAQATPAAAMDTDVTTSARFEQQYLIFVIDHHFGALRMAELAAGTGAHRSAVLSSQEGTSPTPGFRSTAAKAALAEIKALGRRDNRVQREEILAAQRMLMKWYRIRHTPTLSADAKHTITMLERAPAGPEFDKALLRHMSHHHYQVLGPSVQCAVGARLEHGELQRYCEGIVAAQKMEIDDMRHVLCERYSGCHYQPFRAHDGHAGGAAAPEQPVMTHQAQARGRRRPAVGARSLFPCWSRRSSLIRRAQAAYDNRARHIKGQVRWRTLIRLKRHRFSRHRVC